jgi:glutamate:GABA antiporter
MANKDSSIQATKSKKSLGVLSLTLLTIVSVDSMKSLPAAAMFGTHAIFYYLIAACMFLIPTTFVSARLASRTIKNGGVYVWIEQALGKRFGMVAIWLQWISNVLWYPTILAFILGNLSFMINPDLTGSNIFMFCSVIILFTIITKLNLYGLKISGLFSNIASIFGLVLPMILMISLGFIWWFYGSIMQVSVNNWHDFVPSLGAHHSWIACVSIVLSFCGMEIAAVHGRDIINPKRNLPIALWSSMIIILVTLMLGSLAIAIVLPVKQINLVAGLVQAFTLFLKQFHLSSWLPLLVLLLTLGGLGSVSNWVVAPTRGLAIALTDQDRLPYWRHLNEDMIPSRLLWLQWLIVVLLSFLYLFVPMIKQAYWIFTAMASQLYMCMYFIMFVSYYKLGGRLSKQLKNDKKGILMVSLGCISTLVTFILGLFPPDQIQITHTGLYTSGILLASAFLIVLPYWYVTYYPNNQIYSDRTDI